MSFLFSSAKSTMVTPDAALPGRDHYPFEIPADHAVLGTPIRDLPVEPWPEGPWCQVGDLVRTIKYGGDRFVVSPEDDGAPVVFITIQAREIISKIRSFEHAQRMKAFVD